MSIQRSKGFTFAETSLVLAIVGILAGSTAFCLPKSGIVLGAATSEIKGSIHQAFAEARATGENRTVVVGPRGQGIAPNHLPVHLPSSITWGKPAHIPLPPRMSDPVQADTSGEAHRSITVTPRFTCTSTAWFLTDGKDAVCLRLNGHGHLQIFRWHADLRQWKKDA